MRTDDDVVLAVLEDMAGYLDDVYFEMDMLGEEYRDTFPEVLVIAKEMATLSEKAFTLKARIEGV